jgi:hypothetical protein
MSNFYNKKLDFLKFNIPIKNKNDYNFKNRIERWNINFLKKNLKKKKKRQKVFPSYKSCFFSLKPLLFLELISSSFLVRFKQSKVPWEHQLKLKIHCGVTKATKQHPKTFWLFGYQFSNDLRFSFSTFWSPLNSRYHNFLILNPFSKIFSALGAPRQGL